jgi:flagellar biosynthesis/type III secretory pathway protein FliH
LAALLETERHQGAKAMAVTTSEKGVQAGLEQARTTFEKGVQTGLQQGLQQGQRTTLRKQIEARFGPLSTSAQERLDSLNSARLEGLTLELLKAQSLQDLGLDD